MEGAGDGNLGRVGSPTKLRRKGLGQNPGVVRNISPALHHITGGLPQQLSLLWSTTCAGWEMTRLSSCTATRSEDSTRYSNVLIYIRDPIKRARLGLFPEEHADPDGR